VAIHSVDDRGSGMSVTCTGYTQLAATSEILKRSWSFMYSVSQNNPP